MIKGELFRLYNDLNALPTNRQVALNLAIEEGDKHYNESMASPPYITSVGVDAKTVLADCIVLSVGGWLELWKNLKDNDKKQRVHAELNYYGMNSIG